MKSKFIIPQCLILWIILFSGFAISYAAPRLMIDGYDPVTYFTEGKPVKGLKEFEYQWMEATWRFASKENLELFKKEPEKYAPQYGGYCAYAVSQGYTAKVDPEAWDIVDGKLYLNYSKSVRKKWREKRDEYIILADKNWPVLRGKEQKEK